MPDVKANEREFMSQVNIWLNEAISQGVYPFETVSSEASLKTSAKTTNFPDIQIWLNRKADVGGVCEPAVLKSAGVKKISVKKQKMGRVTIAVAEALCK